MILQSIATVLLLLLLLLVQASAAGSARKINEDREAALQQRKEDGNQVIFDGDQFTCLLDDGYDKTLLIEQFTFLLDDGYDKSSQVFGDHLGPRGPIAQLKETRGKKTALKKKYSTSPFS